MQGAQESYRTFSDKGQTKPRTQQDGRYITSNQLTFALTVKSIILFIIYLRQGHD